MSGVGVPIDELDVEQMKARISELEKELKDLLATVKELKEKDGDDKKTDTHDLKPLTTKDIKSSPNSMETRMSSSCGTRTSPRCYYAGPHHGSTL